MMMYSVISQKVGAEKTGYIKDWHRQEDGNYVGLYRFTLHKDKFEKLRHKFTN